MRHGVYATFMPKPISEANGNGMHTHLSLFQGSKNAFYDPRKPDGLSKACQSFIAGLLKYAPEMTLVLNQWVNSYKRLAPGFEAPVYVTWAHKSRSDLIRIPSTREGGESDTRVELRSPDAACNPYLAFACMLAAGLAGIEEELPPVPPVEENVFEMSGKKRRERGIRSLPGSLYEATRLAEESDFLKSVFGAQLFDKFIENKKLEWEPYRAHVSDFELKKYLSIL